MVTAQFGVVGSGQQPARMPPAAHFREMAALVERVGFDSLWSTDHVSFEHPIHEGLVALAFFAGCTRRVQLGTGIYLLALRHPSVVAKQVASLAELSEGRLIFGVGVGGEGEKDFEAVQVPREERGARTDEAIDVLRTLWSRRHASFDGQFCRFEGVTIDPAPSRPVPIWAGGRAAKALARVGERCDGWLAYLQSPEGFARSLVEIRERAERAGRDPEAITPAIMLPVLVADGDEAAARTLQEHMTERYGRPFDRHRVDRYCLAGSPQRCRDRIGEYLEAGARHIVLNPAGRPEARTEDVERFATELVDPLRDEEDPR